MKDSLLEIMHSAKTVVLTVVGTILSGLITVLELIPEDIGKLVTLIGGLIGIVTLQYWRRQNKKADLEIKLKQLEILEAEARVRKFTEKFGNDS